MQVRIRQILLCPPDGGTRICYSLQAQGVSQSTVGNIRHGVKNSEGGNHRHIPDHPSPSSRLLRLSGQEIQHRIVTPDARATSTRSAEQHKTSTRVSIITLLRRFGAESPLRCRTTNNYNKGRYPHPSPTLRCGTLATCGSKMFFSPGT